MDVPDWFLQWHPKASFDRYLGFVAFDTFWKTRTPSSGGHGAAWAAMDKRVQAAWVAAGVAVYEMGKVHD